METNDLEETRDMTYNHKITQKRSFNDHEKKQLK